MDNLFYLEDGSYMIVDYESEFKRSNMIKYMSYIVRVTKRLYNEHKKYPKIRMLVLYTGDVRRGSTQPVMNLGCGAFSITEAFLSELDANDIWNRATLMVESSGMLGSREIMEIIIYPLIFAKIEDKQNAIRKVIELVRKIKDENARTFVFKCLVVFTDKIIRSEDAEKIKEALMMTQVEKLIYDEAAVKIAKKLLKRGSDVDYVSEVTDLSKDVVLKLFNSITSEKE
ncbi:hypothetical protein [Butyrivibrio sp. YAB3001]|uniref:hypothetical protein n=1 Tax=Butyrivibrio sp. YAB3001 TaxID=1520812 RepID=UPI0008F6870D|nr:hypothetical protein [Butyrivibrio sp. YAB3001]SFD06809.1 hypothetical protein SAMN02910398_03956 [Butyrivibrio sp. YAB3001]